MNIPVANEWPSSLSLPLLDYSGAPVKTVLISDVGQGVVFRRRRFRPSYQNLQLKWIFTQTEFSSFKAFWLWDINNGASSFSLELKYPRNLFLTAWQVRFMGGYQPRYVEGLWEVSAVVCLLQPITVVEPRDPIGPIGSDGLSAGDSEGEGPPSIPTEPPTFSCSENLTVVYSGYGWFLDPGVDPSTIITEEQLGIYWSLYLNERALVLDGLTVLGLGGPYWRFYPHNGTYKSALTKVSFPSTDPESTDGDHLVFTSSGYWVIEQEVCSEF